MRFSQRSLHMVMVALLHFLWFQLPVVSMYRLALKPYQPFASLIGTRQTFGADLFHDLLLVVY